MLLRNLIELKWALVFSLACLMWNSLEEYTGLHGSRIEIRETISLLFAIPASVVFILAIREKRHDIHHGSISWLETFHCGMILTAFIVLLSPLVQYVSWSLIASKYFSNAIVHAVESGSMDYLNAHFFYSLKNFILQGMFGFLIMGFVVSVILSTVYSTPENETVRSIKS